MPELARFFGIIISMYYNDHPPPHFHVRYGTQKAIIDIETLSLLQQSDLSRKFLSLLGNREQGTGNREQGGRGNVHIIGCCLHLKSHCCSRRTVTKSSGNGY